MDSGENVMGLKNGKPCKKCNQYNYNKRGACKTCKGRRERAIAKTPLFKEKRKAYNARPENKKKARRRVKEWKSKNKYHAAAYAHNTRAKERGIDGRITQDDILAVFERDGWQCLNTKCGVDLRGMSPSIDHIIPLAKGGENTRENLQTLCRSCNSRKNVDIVDFRNGAELGKRWQQARLKL